MSIRTFGVSLTAVLLTMAAIGRGTEPPHISVPVQAAPTGQAQPPVTATLDDQSDLAVTVYNSDLALVRDARNLRLGLGVADLISPPPSTLRASTSVRCRTRQR